MLKRFEAIHRYHWRAGGLRVLLVFGFLMATMVSVSFSADIVRTFTGLSAGEEVYGLDASGQLYPFVNTDNYYVNTRGDDSGTLPQVNFNAIGLKSGPDVVNEGVIDLTAIGGTTSTSSNLNNYATVFAYGIGANADVINSGSISVTATGGTATNTTAGSGADTLALAYGIRSFDSVTNSGAITVTATGGTANAGVARAWAMAYGINAIGDVTNRGDITVAAKGGMANGVTGDAYAYGIYHDEYFPAVLTNGGAITVTATGLSSKAYGIFIMCPTSEITELTNHGVIRALAATEAYEVYLDTGYVKLVDTYNLNLDGDPATGSIYVSNSAYEGLDLNNAALTLTSVGDDFQWNTPYRIFAGPSPVVGDFSSASALNPNVVVTYQDGILADASDDTVSLNYRPIGSPFLQGAEVLMHSLALTGNLVNQRLVRDYLQARLLTFGAQDQRFYAAAGNTASDAICNKSGTGKNYFMAPYYTHITKDEAPIGYDSNAVGFVTGYECLGTSHLAGFHLGYGHNEINFRGNGFDDNDEGQDMLSAGIHAMGNLADWTWRTRLTGFYAWHDYSGRTGLGLNLGENADYNSYGVAANLMGGCPLRLGKHLLLPEAGLDHIWISRESFTTEADNPGWELHSSSLDEHQFSAVASLRWLSRFPFADSVLTPSLAAGARYLISNDEIESLQGMAGNAPMTVSMKQDQLAATLDASLLIGKGDLFTELAYAGEYGEDTKVHTAWLRLYFPF